MKEYTAQTAQNNSMTTSQNMCQNNPVCLQLQVFGRKRGGAGLYDRRYEAKTDMKSPALTSVESRRMVAEPVSVQVGAMPRPNGELSHSQGFRIYDIDHKSVTIKGLSGGAGGKTGLYAISVSPEVKELTEREMDYMVRDHAERRWNFCAAPGEKEKSPIITANVHRGVPYNVCATPIEFDGDKPITAVSGSDGKTYTVYEVKDGQITIKEKTYPIKLNDGYYIIRKLTVSECKRLQTVPEWYEFPVSDSQAYKMIGNGWTCDVITYLVTSAINEEYEYECCSE